jgi:hypothetical protein
MMKSTRDHRFPEIESFEDFTYEKERLVFRTKLIEAKLNLTYLEIIKIFSVSNMFFSLAKEVFLPRITDFLAGLIKNAEKTSADEENGTPA